MTIDQNDGNLLASVAKAICRKSYEREIGHAITAAVGKNHAESDAREAALAACKAASEENYPDFLLEARAAVDAIKAYYGEPVGKAMV
jgi:hypothetical protein